MKEVFTSLLIYVFGFVGIVSIGLIPLRSCRALRQVFGVLSSQRRSFISGFCAAVLSVTVLLILFADVEITRRIFRCLSENYCGPSVGSGWAFLAMLGAGYFVFEIILFILSKVIQGSIPKN